jgi:WhiB family transcriptional regulator, redox-sensing transcriptional regulator
VIRRHTFVVRTAPGLGGSDLLTAAAETAWQADADCRQVDAEVFFPEKGLSNAEAKLICMGCEARVECLEWALAKDEQHGVWGGLSRRDRVKLKARRNREATGEVAA